MAMGGAGRGLIRETEWAFRLFRDSIGRSIQCGSSRPLLVVLLLCCAVAFFSAPALPQHSSDRHEQHASGSHDHHAGAMPSLWEGSVEGIAYSEANHHLAGFLVLLIGVSELRQALGWPVLGWTRLLLPFCLMTTGIFLLIWSDHLAWPIGSLSLMETLWGSDPETLQHKIYGLLALTVGCIELLRRLGPMRHSTWAVPLPLFAIVGGLMLFGHTHGDHPGAHKIQLHHTVMGLLAVTAGSSKLMSNWYRSMLSRGQDLAAGSPLLDPPPLMPTSRWELTWAVLILLIGLQLLLYSE